MKKKLLDIWTLIRVTVGAWTTVNVYRLYIRLPNGGLAADENAPIFFTRWAAEEYRRLLRKNWPERFPPGLNVIRRDILRLW